MRNLLLHDFNVVVLFYCICIVLLVNSLSYAENIYYDGSDASLLKVDIYPGHDDYVHKICLFPTNVSSNTVTITGGEISSGGYIDSYVYGGIVVYNGEKKADIPINDIYATGNTVAISGGTVKGQVMVRHLIFPVIRRKLTTKIQSSAGSSRWSR